MLDENPYLLSELVIGLTALFAVVVGIIMGIHWIWQGKRTDIEDD